MSDEDFSRPILYLPAAVGRQLAESGMMPEGLLLNHGSANDQTNNYKSFYMRPKVYTFFVP